MYAIRSYYAEAHDFFVRFAFGVEVRAAFAAADGQAGQGILEYLFKAEEFDDAQVHRRMETQSAFERAEGAVEFNPEPAVDLYVARNNFV